MLHHATGMNVACPHRTVGGYRVALGDARWGRGGDGVSVVAAIRRDVG